MSLNLIVPIAADRPEYEHTMPYVFNFAEDGVLLCIKSIQGLDLTKFEHIYFVILDKLDQKYHLSELLNMQLRNLGLSEKAKVLSLKVPTNSQAETIYECIKQEQIEGGIFVKDADGYFTCDFTETNGKDLLLLICFSQKIVIHFFISPILIILNLKWSERLIIKQHVINYMRHI